ncbi:uncharacterized protein [Nicotiana sylvestris]|uniref:uncharacterized protein n=1 Tax=Nicotiana sylvestris TaxID=4096 RepID=UPI00388C8577
MRRVRSQDRLQGFDPEPERIFHRRLREARDTNNIQTLVQFPGNMAEEQHMAVQEVAMPFMGLPHEDPQQHILNFLEISDIYITNGVTPNYVRLTLFPFSLLDEPKRWLKAEPANSITSWNDLARKFLARKWESLYSAWERFKGLIRDCRHHNQTREVLAHTFIEGLHPETKFVVDNVAGGQVLEKSFDEIYALLNKFSKTNLDWQGEMGRHTVQKSGGVLKLDVVSALSTQISTLTNQVNQMTLIINKQQAQPEWEAIRRSSVKKRKQVTFNKRPTTIESTLEKSKESEKPAGEAMVEQPPPLVARQPPPFPQRLQKVRDNTAYKKFLDILKKVLINNPLVDILQEVPKYAKYIKDIVENKRRLTEFETMALTKECSSRI